MRNKALIALGITLLASAAFGQAFTGPASISQPTTINHCLKIAATGGSRIVDSGAACGTGSGTVTSVTGTANQIDVATGTTTPVLTLSSTAVLPGSLVVTGLSTMNGQATNVGATATSPGWYAQITGDTTPRVRVGVNAADNASIAFGPGNTTRDLFLERGGAAATARWGTADAAAPVAQNQIVQSVVTGTSNTAGSLWKFVDSGGTGTGASGGYEFDCHPAGSTGSTQNPASVCLAISGARAVAIPVSLSVGGATIGTDALAWTGTATGSGLFTVGGLTNTLNGAASTPVELYSGTVFTGGSGTTTMPHILVRPTGTTAATTWSTSGTGLGMNLATGFAGNFLDFRVAGGASLFSIASTGDVTAPNITASGTITGVMRSNATLNNSNFGVVSGTSVSTTTTSSLLLAGAATTTLRVSLRGSANGAIGAGNSYGAVVIGDQNVTEAASGTHPLIASLALRLPTITGGVAATTDATTLYIEGAPTGITPTNPASALWIAAGLARFDGTIRNSGITSDSGLTDTAICQDTTNHQYYSGSGAAGICLGTSTADSKIENSAIDYGLKELLQLRPLAYRYKEDWGMPTNKDYYGFFAEEINKVMPFLAPMREDGKVQNYDYVGLITVLVKAIQEQQVQIDDIRRQLAAR